MRAMARASTHQLIRFVYNELPVLDRLETEYALTQNDAARAEYCKLLEAQRLLPSVRFSPPQITVDAILAYSQRGMMETA